KKNIDSRELIRSLVRLDARMGFRVGSALRAVNIFTLDSLINLSPDEAESIPGIGKRSLSFLSDSIFILKPDFAQDNPDLANFFLKMDEKIYSIDKIPISFCIDSKLYKEVKSKVNNDRCIRDLCYNLLMRWNEKN